MVLKSSNHSSKGLACVPAQATSLIRTLPTAIVGGGGVASVVGEGAGMGVRVG